MYEEPYLEPLQTSMMELFVKICNNFKPKTTFAKSSKSSNLDVHGVLNICGGSEVQQQRSLQLLKCQAFSSCPLKRTWIKHPRIRSNTSKTLIWLYLLKIIKILIWMRRNYPLWALGPQYLHQKKSFLKVISALLYISPKRKC